MSTEAMFEAGTIKAPQITAAITEYLGADDDRVFELSKLQKTK